MLHCDIYRHVLPIGIILYKRVGTFDQALFELPRYKDI